MLKSLITIVSLAVSLCACSLLSPVSVTPPNQYLISSTPANAELPFSKRGSGVLLVSMPDITPTYNTTRMAYMKTPYQIQYFSQNEWAETPAQMLQTVLVATLEKTGRYKAVVIPPYAGRYDYILSTNLLSWQQNLMNKNYPFEISLRAQMIRVSDNRLLGSDMISINVPVPYKTPYDTVVMANKGASQAALRVAQFASRLR